jgi:hypothetical protein
MNRSAAIPVAGSDFSQPDHGSRITDHGSRITDHGHGEVDRASWPAALSHVEVDQLAGRLVQTDLESLDLAEPTVELGLVNALAQVGDDLDKP